MHGTIVILWKRKKKIYIKLWNGKNIYEKCIKPRTHNTQKTLILYRSVFPFALPTIFRVFCVTEGYGYEARETVYTQCELGTFVGYIYYAVHLHIYMMEHNIVDSYSRMVYKKKRMKMAQAQNVGGRTMRGWFSGTVVRVVTVLA